MKVSKQSVRRYLQYILGIEEPLLCFHQTLTFNPPETDERRAHRLFQELMDNLHNRPTLASMASVYFRDVHRKGGVHYHVLFYFFDERSLPFPPSKMYERFRTVVFSAWNGKQGGKLAYVANALEQRKPDFGYFLDKLSVAATGEKTVRPKVRWWNVWNKRVLDAYRRPVPKGDVDAEYKRRFGPEPAFSIWKDPTAPKRVYSRANVRAMKANHEDIGLTTWDEEKRLQTGLKGKVTDEQFRAILNERLRASRGKVRP